MDFKRLKVNICGVNVDDISAEIAVDKIIKMARDKSGGHYVVTVNSEFVMMAHKNRKFAQILNNADLAVADGVGIVLAKLILGGREHERVTGVGLVYMLCEKVANKPITLGFLGGFGSVAAQVSKRQKEKYIGLKVAYAGSGDPAIGYDSRLKTEFSRLSRIDILFVAYGMGQQEFWIERNRKNLNVGVFIGVGGTFDYISGVKKRAPVIMQKVGLEWLWRLMYEPSRIWRMRLLPVFVLLVFSNFFKKTLLKFCLIENNYRSKI